MIFSYNKEYVGDTLIVITADDKGLEQTAVRKGNVAQIKNEEGTIVGWNFFHISDTVAIEGNGQVVLTKQQVETLNRLITEAGFTEQLAIDLEPQIVCGAANIRKGLKVVVAKPGAMMPDGLLIWPGTLRGVDSYGMICSARELHLANAPLKKGILELPQDAVVGEAFPVGK